VLYGNGDIRWFYKLSHADQVLWLAWDTRNLKDTPPRKGGDGLLKKHLDALGKQPPAGG
jgi:hypothetical protein